MKKTIRLTKNELNEIIKRVVNEIFENNNYTSKLADSELDDFTYLSEKDTSLPYEIYVDCGEGYKRNKHPLCLYIVRGQNIIPVTISENPICIGRVNNSREIKDFIKRNYWALKKYADMEMSSPEFYDSIDATLSQSMLMEMGNYYFQDTGLPVIVWVDETQAYKRSPWRTFHLKNNKHITRTIKTPSEPQNG